MQVRGLTASYYIVYDHITSQHTEMYSLYILCRNMYTVYTYFYTVYISFYTMYLFLNATEI